MVEPQIEKTILDTVYGSFDFRCFSWGSHEEDNLLCLSSTPIPEVPLVRVQSACYTAEIFRSKDCDCREQLEEAQRRIGEEGGVLIYMLCDGRGAGLLKKVHGLELGRSEGMNTSEAYREMGLEQDPREYTRVAWILEHLGIKSVRLLTNNPRKVAGLETAGLKVTREPLEIAATEASRAYLEAKRDHMGHLLEGL